MFCLTIQDMLYFIQRGERMQHVTVGQKYNSGKIALVECGVNADLSDIQIKDTCFLLLYLTQGSMSFEVNGEIVTANAPCFICFDEQNNPVLHSQKNAEYFYVYFHPQFLNVNLTFSMLRSERYSDLASVHDLFLLEPFLKHFYTVPVCENYRQSLDFTFEQMEKELREQRDWYWSCRGRSYFLEIIIVLERMVHLFNNIEKDEGPRRIVDAKLQEALLFIEGHYTEDISLGDICRAAHINHTTLTALAKQQLGMTVIEYLTRFRVKVAKKLLAFTEIPIKEVSFRCGYKTVQHFSHIFKKYTDQTPAAFRENAVQNRKNNIHP